MERIEGEGGSHTERENLPDEVEPRVTYRDVRVRWRAGAKLKAPSSRETTAPELLPHLAEPHSLDYPCVVTRDILGHLSDSSETHG